MKAVENLIPVLEGTAAARWVDEDASPAPDAAMRERVREIIERVRSEGDAALISLAAELDGGRPSSIRVDPERCREALAATEPERRKALETARRNIERFHEAQRRREDVVEIDPGVRAWREFRPIDRVGIYAPGGRAAYPSSVLMTAVPARVAGVAELAVCCPAGPSGQPPEPVMAACALLEIEELYALGGAQAIAAMALGTETVPRVDKIVGPGGAWVNAAKLALFEEVAIDLPAGPSEVNVWADASANPDWIAAELLAQAEHGPDSVVAAVLSDDTCNGPTLEAIARQVALSATDRLEALSGSPRHAARESLSNGAVLVAETDEEGARWINALAPEHLSIQRRDAGEALSRIRHAGSVFVGEFAPVAAGDYCSGTNHVLPTGGRTRGASGLSVSDFGRWMQVQQIDRGGLEALAPAIEALAEWEGLPAHAESVRARLGTASVDGERNR